MVTLCAEGSSDRWLWRPIEWLIRRAVPEVELSLTTHFSIGAGDAAVAARVAYARTQYPADVLFVHRDADGAGYDARRAEVERAATGLTFVPVVPVVMSEAWLLLDEHAIRFASGNPAGTAPLDLPKPSAVERIADPKARLAEAMRAASEERGRRHARARRGRGSWPALVAERVGSFERHLSLPAFQRLAEDIRLTMTRVLASQRP